MSEGFDETAIRGMGERIARLEQRAEAHAASAASAAAEAKDERERVEVHFHRVEQELGEIRKELARYRGTVGGILLAFTAIGTFLKLFGASITAFFKS